MDFEWVNALDGGQGQRRHEELGSPRVPSLVLDGKAIRLLQVSQIASALGLPMPSIGEVHRLAWDTVPILEDWIEVLQNVDWEYLLTPTPSRQRSIRNLTVNTFHPFELLPEAWDTAEFLWDSAGPLEIEREGQMTDKETLLAWMQRTSNSWQSFLLDHEEELQGEGPFTHTIRGDVTYNVILNGQRWHAAWHHRQIVDHLRAGGKDIGVPLDVEMLAEDMKLPVTIY